MTISIPKNILVLGSGEYYWLKHDVIVSNIFKNIAYLFHDYKNQNKLYYGRE